MAAKAACFKPCETCGIQMTDFFTAKSGKPYRLRTAAWEKRRFCSRKCKRTVPLQFKICVACNKRYSDLMPAGGKVTKEKWKKSQWCSKKCRWITQGAVEIRKICVQCGVEFSNLVRRGTKKESFCNSARFQNQKVCSNVCGLRYRQDRTSTKAFYDNVGEKEENGCLIWRGHITKSGHGRITLKEIGNRSILAHRLAYALFKGPVPGNRIVCHACHNASCVNVDHLYLGDYATNAADRYRNARPEAKSIRKTHRLIAVDEHEVLIMEHTARTKKSYLPRTGETQPPSPSSPQ